MAVPVVVPPPGVSEIDPDQPRRLGDVLDEEPVVVAQHPGDPQALAAGLGFADEEEIRVAVAVVVPPRRLAGPHPRQLEL